MEAEEASEKLSNSGGQDNLAGEGLTDRDLGNIMAGIVKLCKGGEGERERPMSALETACLSLERGESDRVSVVAIMGSVDTTGVGSREGT